MFLNTKFSKESTSRLPRPNAGRDNAGEQDHDADHCATLKKNPTAQQSHCQAGKSHCQADRSQSRGTSTKTTSACPFRVLGAEEPAATAKRSEKLPQHAPHKISPLRQDVAVPPPWSSCSSRADVSSTSVPKECGECVALRLQRAKMCVPQNAFSGLFASAECSAGRM